MKIGFLSLGCPKNLVDGEVMLGLAREAGHEITADASDAEAIVINTCAFIDRAKEESIDAILEMARLKRYRDELRQEIPEIDAVLGTGEVPDIVAALGGERSARPSSAAPLRLFRPSDFAAAAGVIAPPDLAVPDRPLTSPGRSVTRAPAFGSGMAAASAG